MRMLRALLALLLACCTARAAPVQFDLNLSVPDVVRDSVKPRACTIAYLVTDVTTNDTYAVRMQVTPLPNATPEGERLPCPQTVAPRVALRALNACTDRATDAKTCVYSDMSRGFAQAPELTNTAENTSRCMSDAADFIGVACWNSGGLDVCNVGCGHTREEAETAAQARCAEKQQQSCTITTTVPVLAP